MNKMDTQKLMLQTLKKQAEEPERKRTENARAICNLLRTVNGRY